MQDPDFNTPVNKLGLQQLGFPMAARRAPGQPRPQQRHIRKSPATIVVMNRWFKISPLHPPFFIAKLC